MSPSIGDLGGGVADTPISYLSVRISLDLDICRVKINGVLQFVIKKGNFKREIPQTGDCLEGEINCLSDFTSEPTESTKSFGKSPSKFGILDPTYEKHLSNSGECPRHPKSPIGCSWVQKNFVGKSSNWRLFER